MQEFSKSSRKYYIDNLRSICILLLFPFHTAMMFNDFGEAFYVQGVPFRVASYINQIIYPWWMSGLFVLAGMSSVYALRSRTGREFLSERFKKLFIPLISALILLIPVQPYIADIFHNGYSGGYLDHFKTFFTISDLTGNDGKFTPAQTWFILYLFVISLITLPLLLWYTKKSNKLNSAKFTMTKLVLLMFVIELISPILDIGGKSLGEYTACFLIGYFVMSMDEVQERLSKNSWWLGIIWILLMIVRCLIYNMWVNGSMDSWNETAVDILFEILTLVFSWMGILAMLGLGKRFLEFHNPVTEHFAKASFPVYLFHQSVLIIVGYFVFKTNLNNYLQYFIIMLSSFAITILLYEVCRYIKPLRFLFGIKR